MTDTDDANDLWESSRDQDRVSSDSGTPVPAGPVVDAIQDAYSEIDDGRSPNLTLRDGDLAALVFGLEDMEELEALQRELADHLGVEVNDTTRAETLRLAVRAGLREAVPEVVDDARAAKAGYESDSAF